jgi:tRNA U34 5-methylaminomethyl-2-thiouridine-forming methyltransferase MnmC
MKKVTTHDGSETFLNEKVGESYHSFTGAIEEAEKKFCEPTKIKEIARLGEIKLLDFCFGLGYNSAMAINIALEENHNCKFEVIALENDPAIIDKIQDVNPQISYYKHFKKLTLKNHQFKEDNVSVKLYLDDARKIIKTLPDDYFDVVFFDPFSPKTAPEMWTCAIFSEIKRVMKKGGVLATYSCARLVRDNLKCAGLNYEDGPKVGRRGPGTIARN